MGSKPGKKRKYLFISVAVAIVIAIFVCSTAVFYKCNQHAKEISTYSAVASIHASLQSDEVSSEPNVQAIFERANDQWYVLSTKEYDAITSDILKHYGVDGPSPKGYPVDYWGNHLIIGIRREPDNQLEFFVTSKGKDGVFGTSDDIVSPLDFKPTESIQALDRP
jgi:hypothetical protein